MLGFELLVNQRLLPPTFPRSTRIKSLEDTYAFLEGLLFRIRTVMRVTSLHDFHSIIDFFNGFSESGPCVLSRSLLQLLYAPMRFKKPGLEEMINSMKDAVKDFIAPPILTSKIPQQQNKEVSATLINAKLFSPFAVINLMTFPRLANAFKCFLIDVRLHLLPF